MGICASKDDNEQPPQRVQTKSAVPMKKAVPVEPTESKPATASGSTTGAENKVSRQQTSETNSLMGPNESGTLNAISNIPSTGGAASIHSGEGTLSGSNQNKALKVLLLGSGESGKSTVLQQLKILHQNGFTKSELYDYKPFVFCNIIDSARDVIRAYRSLEMEIENPQEAEDAVTLDDFEYIMSNNPPVDPSDSLDTELADRITKLWNLPSTQKLMTERRSDFYLMDSAKYFFESLDRIQQPDYIPNITDVLRTRKKTSGIFDTVVDMDGGLKLHIFDVGGQRSERKKWIHCFDNVTMIIFCVSLSEYDQPLLEDKSQNRLEESLVLFDSVVNSRWFARTSIVLFLNKIDVFAEKLATIPLEKYFPDYTGGSDINKGAKYILWRFIQLNRSNLNVYPHVTQATDTSNIKLVFAAIKETILENTLRDSGVL